MPEFVELRREGAACVLTLNRPEKLNALSTAVEREVLGVLTSPEVRESRCVILAGVGRAFSAGADVTELSRDDPAGIAAYYRETGDVYERIAALPQPTIAAIHGYCLGGGLELALAADFRVADETAVFGLPEVELGILPSSGGAHRLVRIVGPARAKELMLLRDRFGSDEALRLGVVTEVVSKGNAMARALELAERVATLPPLAASVVKQAADLLAGSSREVGVAFERLAYGMLAQTDEARAAARAFSDRKSGGAAP
jgi:enoyl-CoA hydratase/carnithine racemase